MSQRPQGESSPDAHAALPGWVRAIVAMVGVVLLIGPTAAVVWPH